MCITKNENYQNENYQDANKHGHNVVKLIAFIQICIFKLRITDNLYLLTGFSILDVKLFYEYCDSSSVVCKCY